MDVTYLLITTLAGLDAAGRQQVRAGYQRSVDWRLWYLHVSSHQPGWSSRVLGRTLRRRWFILCQIVVTMKVLGHYFPACLCRLLGG